MGKALYRTYRSKTLDDIVGQEHIKTTLKSALKSGSISHAYLFTGPRGVGKTSIARILAHDINDLPYSDDDKTHLDIIEIDAASNNGVEDVRELRDKVFVAPTSAKYKVYIIDEAHMLSTAAFNALLKTLEEPPAHVVFILATTEAHKLPATIISRTQRFTFRPVEPDLARQHLKEIAGNEKIAINDEALGLIAEHGEGSMRDSVNLLDQLSSQVETITAEHVLALLGLPPAQAFANLLKAIATSDSQQLISDLSSLQTHGLDALRLAKHLSHLLRQQMINDQLVVPKGLAVKLLGDLLDVPAYSSSNPLRKLELVLLGACLSNEEANEPAIEASAPSLRSTPSPELPKTNPVKTDDASDDKPSKAAKVNSPAPKDRNTPVEKQAQLVDNSTTRAAKVATEPNQNLGQNQDESELTVETQAEPTSSIAVGDVDTAVWPQVLDSIKHQHNTLYGIARMAKVSSIDNGLCLGFKFAFHQKRVNEPKNKTLLIEAIEKLTGVRAVLECMIREDDSVYSEAPAAADGALNERPASQQEAVAPVLQNISNIFGSAEVLNS